MKYILSLCLLLFMVGLVQAQSLRQPKLLLGFETAGHSHTIKDLQADSTYRFFQTLMSPYFNVYLSPNIAFGLGAEYDFVRSDYTSRDPAFGYGAQVRYTFKAWEMPKNWPPPSSFKNLFMRFKPYAELNYRMTNYYVEDKYQFIEPTLKYHRLRFCLGTSAFIYKGLALNLAITPNYYIGQSFHLNGRVALEYYFLRITK